MAKHQVINCLIGLKIMKI